MTKAIDPRTPVLVGVGQLSQRVDRGAPALEPADLMVEALRRADADAGASVAAAADSVRVVSLLSWRYRDPGRLVAERLGADPRDTAVTPMGGNSPQALVNQSCLDIVAGRADVVLLAGAEAWRSRSAAKQGDSDLGWTVQGDDVEPARVLGEDLEMNHPDEVALGIFLPVQIYPLFEHAVWHASGRTLDEHLRVVSELWARFSEVASRNPHAWIQEACSAEQIRTVTPDNRMVGFPYTKLLNSNNAVEQGAGLILCSAGRATELGVPRDRWVFPLSGTDAHDHPFVSNRHDLCSSPAIRAAGRAAMELAGVGPDDVAHVDLYSCFPSAVQIAAAELGFPLERQLTVTGGLSFAGGPWNNYVMHAIASMADTLRADPGSVGLCSANGGYVTKHAFGLYSTEPPAAGFRHADAQQEADATPARELASRPDARVRIEAHTVMFGRDGAPERAIATCLLDDGRRAWGTSDSLSTMEAMAGFDLTGEEAKVSADGQLEL